MKVLFLTDSLSDLDGVGRYAHRLIAALERNRPGLEVHVLLARKHHPTSDAVPDRWRVDVALPPDWYFYMKPLRFWVWRLLAGWKTWRGARSADRGPAWQRPPRRPGVRPPRESSNLRFPSET